MGAVTQPVSNPGRVAHRFRYLQQVANTFPRPCRLLNGAAFNRVFEQPLVSQDRYFRILARAAAAKDSKMASPLPGPRLGLAISKRMDNRAVARNRIKRLARESFRLHASELPALDFVVIGRQAAVVAENPELFESLKAHWRRLSKKAEEQTND